MTQSRESRPTEAFLEQYWRDREAGSVRSLEDYIAQFPGDWERIAREYLQLRATEAIEGGSVDLEDHQSLGPYKIVEELGRGGQGVVYLAEDERLGRKVALKVLKSLGPGSEDILLRFKREAAVASRLDDPGICAVYDTGIENGVPYIAMRFVEGESLADKISTLREIQTPAVSTCINLEDLEGNDLDTEAEQEEESTSTGPGSRDEIMRVVSLFEQVARSLHAAHEAGVIHRDVKPGNIMVTSGGQGVIMDFGLARADEEDLPTLTRSGDLFGTPAYMSPEQLTRQSVRLDSRTDVWSLGVALYECLTLKRPFEAPTREGLFQAIMTREPRDPRRVNPLIPKDLATVTLVALEKDRDRRYQSAEDLARDLQRVREQRPVAAKPVGPLGRVMRWAQRNPLAAGGLAAAFLALAGGLVVSLMFSFEARRESAAKSEALGRVTAEERAKAVALRERTAALAEKETALQERTRALARSEGLRLAALARQNLDENPGLAVALSLDGAERTSDVTLRRVLREGLDRLHEGAILIRVDPSLWWFPEFTPDGRSMLAVAGGGVAHWDLESGELRHVFVQGVEVTDFALSRDGRHLLARGSRKNGPAVVSLWEIETRRRVWRYEGPASHASMSDDAGRVLVCLKVPVNREGEPRDVAEVWDPVEDQRVRTLRARSEGSHHGGVSPDGRWVALMQDVASSQKVRSSLELVKRLHVWGLAPGAPAHTIDTEIVFHADPPVFRRTPDAPATVIVSGQPRFCVHTFDAASGKKTSKVPRMLQHFLGPQGTEVLVTAGGITPRFCRLRGPGSADRRIRLTDPESTPEALSHDGRLLALRRGKSIDIVDIDAGGLRVATLAGHTDGVVKACFTPDGRLLSAARDGTCRSWQVRSFAERYTLELPRVLMDADGGVQQLPSSSPEVPLSVHPLGFSPDGRHLVGTLSPRYGTVSVSLHGVNLLFGVHLVERATGRVLRSLPGVWGHFVGGNGRLVTRADLTSPGGPWRLWDPDATGELASPETSFFGIVSGKEGPRIAHGSAQRLRIRDADSGRDVVDVEMEGTRHSHWSVSPDGRHVIDASASLTAPIQLRSAETGEVVATLESRIRVASRLKGILGRIAGRDQAGDGRVTHQDWQIAGMTSLIFSHSWSGDGAFLAVRRISFIEVYDVRRRAWKQLIAMPGTEASRGVLERRPGDVDFHPSGRYLAVTDAAKERSWVFDLETGEGVFGVAAERIRFSPDGEHLLVDGEEGIRIHDAPGFAPRDLVAGVRLGPGAAFTPDGRWLAVPSGSCRVTVVPLDPVAAARAHVQRRLSAEERDAYEIGERRDREEMLAHEHHDLDVALCRLRLARIYQRLLAHRLRSGDYPKATGPSFLISLWKSSPESVQSEFMRSEWTCPSRARVTSASQDVTAADATLRAAYALDERSGRRSRRGLRPDDLHYTAPSSDAFPLPAPEDPAADRIAVACDCIPESGDAEDLPHQGRGICVLYLSGRTEFIPAKRFEGSVPVIGPKSSISALRHLVPGSNGK